MSSLPAKKILLGITEALMSADFSLSFSLSSRSVGATLADATAIFSLCFLELEISHCTALFPLFSDTFALEGRYYTTSFSHASTDHITEPFARSSGSESKNVADFCKISLLSTSTGRISVET